MPPSGQRSQTSDSWSMAANAAPARGNVAGKGHREARAAVGLEYRPDVGPLDDGLPGDGQLDRGCGDQDGVGQPGPGPGEPGAGPVVPPERDHGHGGQRERRDRAEDQQRGRGAAGAEGEGEEHGRGQQQAAQPEPGLGGEPVCSPARCRGCSWGGVVPVIWDQVALRAVTAGLAARCASRCSMAMGSSRTRYPVAW